MSTTTSPAADTQLPWYCYPEAYNQVRRFTAEHELTVLRDEGQYKHLRFARPGTGIYAFEAITWPGHLATAGDVGAGFMFARVPNMLSFFDHGQPEGHINADYWLEKLVGRGRSDVRVWSKERFTQYATQRVDELLEVSDLDDGQVTEVKDGLAEILRYADDEHETLEAWRDFAVGDHLVEDEWDSRAWTDYDHHAVLALHLILMVAQRYHAVHGRVGTGE